MSYKNDAIIRIDTSKGIDINKPNKPKECMICH